MKRRRPGCRNCADGATDPQLESCAAAVGGGVISAITKPRGTAKLRVSNDPLAERSASILIRLAGFGPCLFLVLEFDHMRATRPGIQRRLRALLAPAGFAGDPQPPAAATPSARGWGRPEPCWRSRSESSSSACCAEMQLASMRPASRADASGVHVVVERAWPRHARQSLTISFADPRDLGCEGSCASEVDYPS
jgi:hypothetical protein